MIEFELNELFSCCCSMIIFISIIWINWMLRNVGVWELCDWKSHFSDSRHMLNVWLGAGAPLCSGYKYWQVFSEYWPMCNCRRVRETMQYYSAHALHWNLIELNRGVVNTVKAIQLSILEKILLWRRCWI